MFKEKDKTYDDLREKSTYQWLDGMSNHEDLTVRGGVKVTLAYIESLKKAITNLESENAIKDGYLEKMRAKNIKK